MVGVENTSGTVKGCIKATRGPWLVHRTNKDGRVSTKLRFPSERERLNNQQREKRRRDMTRMIFAGLRAHGNYGLPKQADNNDLLIALCNEAGWHVKEDGTIFRKVPSETQTSSSCATSSDNINCVENGHLGQVDGVISSITRSLIDVKHREDLDLTLSL